jgi:N-acetylmuramoyl-L-alanine amidase
MNLLLYLLKLTLVSGILFGYYHLFLRNRPFHHYNRFFLLGAALLSFLIPLVHIPSGLLNVSAAGKGTIRLLQISPGNWEESVTVTPGDGGIPFLSWQEALILLYLLISSLLLLVFFRSLLYLGRILRKYPRRQVDGINCYDTEEPGAPFSFFNHIFWKGPFDSATAVRDPVFLHEKCHILQRHSADRLFFECLKILCWFNPFFHLMQKEIKALHEFLADEYAVAAEDRFVYAERLILEAGPKRWAPLANPFFNNQIKRRIMMIMKNNVNSRHRTGRIMILPILFLVIIAFGFRFHPGPGYLFSAPEKMRVIIDAGHGGMDPGSNAYDVKEKDLTLPIANKIAALAPAYGIEVVLTRTSDELPGNAKSIAEGLKYRTELAGKTEASALVSIHINADPDKKEKSGFEIEIPKQTSPYIQSTIALGSSFVNAIAKDYAINPELKQPSANIYIFKNATVPTLIIECGYLTNATDLAFIREDKNQEIIARDILSGLVRYSKANAGGPAAPAGTKP